MAFTKNAYRDIYPAVQPTRPELSQAGKVVVITGATRICGCLCPCQGRSNRFDWTVWALAETEKRVKEISPATMVISIAVDILDEDGVNAAFEKIVAQCGIPNVLINNAGCLVLETIAESTTDSFWKVQEVNVTGTLIVTKAFLNSIEPGSEEQRAILNLTSVSTQYAAVTMDSYTISKVAVTKFTEFLAAEYPSITSISLGPGMVATDMGVSVGLIAPFLFDTVDLVGGVAVWLCSGDKRFLSGRYVSVNWDVDELERRKEEIVAKDLLSSGLRRGEVAVDELVIHS
ncbi:hypothetical protein CNMCM5878_006698 [Aspergillus fumigatiaffinis]|nr:hypothetical protein CNMCM6457_002791 [Aspergillus fumigatiaffinis]KAF4222103.1 hypothetical protein CNMCM5878_006698 [Aspergillus fumigatiaffinis]